MKKTLKVLMLASAAAWLVGCSSIPSPSQRYAKYSADQIYKIAEVKLAKAEYRDSIEAFEGLDSLYPFSQYSQQAQLDIIYAYIKNYEMPSAAAAAERYIRLYPRATNVDYAYYLKGVANFNQDRGFFQRYLPVNQSTRDPGTMTQAYDDFSTLIKLFPNSPYATDARQRIIYLREVFASRRLEIAKFYFQKQAYVAAINRADEVLTNYSDTAAAREALIVMYESYQKLGLTKEIAQTQQLLTLNHVDPKSLKIEG